MAEQPRPYSHDKLYNAEDPSLRNLHDDVNKFYREVMQLKTPLTQNSLPKCREVKEALVDTPRSNIINKILCDIRATTLKSLWPDSTQVPGNAIGVLWKAVSEVIPGVADEDIALASNPIDNHLSLEYFIDPEKKILIDDTTYFTLLQDIGYEVTNKKRPKKCYVEKDKVTGKMKAYINIYQIGMKYYDIISKHKKTFSKLPKNKSAVIQRVCKFVMDNRELKGYADVHDADIRAIINKNDFGDEDFTTPTHVYLYDQTYLFNKVYNIWCPLGVERKETTLNDKLRVFGIMTSTDYRDEMNLLSRGKGQNREGIDNPELRSSAIYDRFAEAFNNEDFHIQHPVHYHHLHDAVSMNPNETARIQIQRDGKWFQNVYESTMKHYRPTMIKYKSGTGGGSGYPENFSDWRLRNPWEFQNYDKVRGALLAWIFMKDNEARWILDSKNDDIPESIQVETTKTGNSNFNQRVKSPTMGVMDGFNKQMEKFDSLTNDFFEKYNSKETQTIKIDMNCDQELQVKLDNIDSLRRLLTIYGNNPIKRRQLEMKIETCLDQMLTEDNIPGGTKTNGLNIVDCSAGEAIDNTNKTPNSKR